MGRRWDRFINYISGATPTNYGYGYLEDGRYMTFLRQVNGTLLIQTPVEFKDRTAVKLISGYYEVR